MNFNLEETLLCMKDMGFTEYEAKVYISLLTFHPASAYTISQNSEVPHSRVYDITRRLIKKGFAVSSGTNPELFSPLSPDEMVAKLKRDAERTTERIRNSLVNIEFNSDFDPVWNLSGREEALGMAIQLINGAEEEIYIGVWDEELEILLPHLKEAYGRGVRVIMLIYGNTTPDFGQYYHHSIENISRVTEYGRTLDFVADFKACITGSLGLKKPPQAVWTRNKGLINSIEGYIIHDLYIVEINRIFGSEIDGVFGKNLSKLRDKYKH